MTTKKNIAEELRAWADDDLVPTDLRVLLHKAVVAVKRLAAAEKVMEAAREIDSDVVAVEKIRALIGTIAAYDAAENL